MLFLQIVMWVLRISQVDSRSLSADGCGVRGMFVGVSDGNGGPEAARFVNDRLFHNVKSMLLVCKSALVFHMLL